MTITRETLELAAKAAGLRHIEYNNDYDGRFGLVLCDETGRHTRDWSPLTDHGQLLNLAMACKIDILPSVNEISYYADSKTIGVYHLAKSVDTHDFPALAEAVIQAAAEQQMAKEGK